MRRIKLTEVLMTLPVETDGDDYDLEVDDETMGIVELASACLHKVTADLEQQYEDSVGEAQMPEPEVAFEDMSLADFRAKPLRTRPRGTH